MKKLFAVPGNPVVIDSNTVIWRMPERQVKMTVEPAESLAGFASWDTPNLKAPTFEPFFYPFNLKAGEQITYSLNLLCE